MKKIFLILILGIFILSGHKLFAMDAQLWNAPLVPDAVVVWKDKPINVANINARATLLRSKMDTKQILEFYESTLVKDGWEIKDVFVGSNITAFIKENNYMYIGVGDNGKDLPRDVYIISSPGDLAICRLMAANMGQGGLLQKDVEGQDAKDIPRYPGSKRMMNIFSSQEGDSLMYQARGTVNEIARFYQDSLKATGWKLANTLDPNNPQVRKNLPVDVKLDADAFKSIDFEKGKDILSISVYTFDKAQKICLIMVMKYSEQALNNMIGG
ncbi:MAG: hypothetical protein NTY47_05345 [Candidatus Omnitrophica bacterium]|nr:hypothetical protein [Candidatus Omnitrophota bacterium]